MTETKDNFAVLAFVNVDAFEQWLAANPDAKCVWLKFAKRGGSGTLTKTQAIDAALCHGWIDGQLGRLDDDFYLTRFTPRKAGSRWSAANVKRAEALAAQGRMRAGGFREIEAAKADGRWAAAYPSASKIGTPPDFEAALALSPGAARTFASLDGANRYAVLYRLHHAKPAVRAERVAAMVGMLERGETFHAPRKARQAGESTIPKRGPVGKTTSS